MHMEVTEIFGRIFARFFRDEQKISFYNVCLVFLIFERRK